MSKRAVYLPPIDATPNRIAQSLFVVRESNMTILDDILQYRNEKWEDHALIPSWVDLDTVDLDQYYTRPEIAEQCYENLLSVIRADYGDPSEYVFVDAGAGTGAFYDLLPIGRKIGVDIDPTRPEFIRNDYLSWIPPRDGKRYVVVGNPPFGYRAWLALAFMNHSATFADYIGFILPMAFQSEGKGSPKHRVVGAQLIHAQDLPGDAFSNSKSQTVKINALWQVWKRGVNNRKPKLTCDDWIELFTVDMRKERLCGQTRMKEAGWFLQRTFYHDPPTLVRSFADVRYVCGYGIIIKKESDRITEHLKSVDWKKYSNLAAHNCRHISMYHIRQAMIDGGFVDEPASNGTVGCPYDATNNQKLSE